MKKSALALLILTLFSAGSSTAMSLGRHRGVALVGRPLDISVQAVLEAQDDPAALCIEADAFYADNRLDKSLVRVSSEKALSNPLDTIIRIRSTLPVDEPVVTLLVRAGCQQKTERRYVILADLASEPASLPSRPAAAGAGGSNLPVPLATGGTISAGASVVTSATSSPVLPSFASASSSADRRNSAWPVATLTSGPGSSVALTAGQPAAAISPKPEVPSAKRDSPRVRDVGASGRSDVGKARLKLEPVDLSIEREPLLKSSTELLSVPASEQQRSAAAALWRALAAQPQDILRDAEKIQALESSLTTLRAQAQKNQLALNELNSHFEKSRLERYANWLVYALGLLLILALAGLIYMWRLHNSSDAASTGELPWWRKNKRFEKGWAENFPESALPVAADSMFPEDTNSPTVAKKDEEDKTPAHALLQRDSVTGADQPAFTEVSHISRSGGDSLLPSLASLDFTVSIPHVARTVNAEELFDVQQQADFFVSLGQYEQALDVLRGHMAGSIQTSPMIYMDLFNLYRQLDRQADYQALRTDFNQLFTGNIPAFENYTSSGSGLDAYPVALTRIEDLWPSPEVLEVIAEFILRRPVGSEDAFDLEAYRELQLLYSVAREIVQAQGVNDPGAFRFDLPAATVENSSAQNPGFLPAAIAPLSATAVESGIKDHEPMLATPASRLPLDVDLGDLAGVAEIPQAGAGVPSNSNSNFFARLGTKIPVGSAARSAAPAASPAPPPEVDNMIDFDAFDSFVKNLNQPGPPKT